VKLGYLDAHYDLADVLSGLGEHEEARRHWQAYLVAAGKPRMQAVGACMRKLIMLCYGLLKNQAPFDPAWPSRIVR
jgi:hypothetical protein